jgi:hypothetical protein
MHISDDCSSDAVVLGAETTPAGNDPWGEVITRSMRLKARSVPDITEYKESFQRNLLVAYKAGLLDMTWYEDGKSRSGRDLEVVLILMEESRNSATYLVLIKVKHGIRCT